MKDKVLQVYNSLNNVTISGRQNCTIIATCQNILEEIYNELLNKENEAEVESTKE